MFSVTDVWERADWPLLQNGAVNLFHAPEILAQARSDLDLLGYEIAEISCREDASRFERQVSDLLRWEEQFDYAPWSGNLNALADAMAGYAFGASARNALVLDGFHVIAGRDAGYAHALLDILESAARDHLLFGSILVMLVQTDDRNYVCPPIGSRRANWNEREAMAWRSDQGEWE